MEKRISNKIDNFFLQFKDDIKEHIVKTDKGTGQFNDLLKYIYEYEKLNLNKGLFLTIKWYLENTQWIQKINKKKYSNRLGLKL